MRGEDVLHLIKEVTGAFEAYYCTEYEVYRNTGGGGVQKVKIRILGGGPSMGSVRYHVHAESEDGRTATGNQAESIETALAIVHWGNLDK